MLSITNLTLTDLGLNVVIGPRDTAGSPANLPIGETNHEDTNNNTNKQSHPGRELDLPVKKAIDPKESTRSPNHQPIGETNHIEDTSSNTDKQPHLVHELDVPVKKGEKGKPTGKKRVRNEMNHKTKLRKLKRNTGQEYVTKKGKVVKAKVFENKDCGCSKRCMSRVTSEERQKCFDKFWKMGDFSKQNAYLSGLVTREAVKQHRPRTNVKNRGPKGVTYQYRINVGRISYQVCKVYFLDTFLVSNGRLARALRKEENEREPGEDLRGRRPPANKTSEENLNRVKEHISQFHHYDSQGALNPKGKYLNADLNVKKMYKMYLEECQCKNVSFVKENIYRSVFNEEFNLTFLSPRKDTFTKLRPDIVKSQTPVCTTRKKKNSQKTLTYFNPENNVQMRPPQTFNIPPQIFCPAENAKCSYNPNMVPTSLHQDKDSGYQPNCLSSMSGPPPFYHQEQVPPTFHNQSRNFYDM